MKNKQYLNVAKFSVAQSDNPDLLKFSAVVGYLDTPTDGTPCGALSGYKTVISSEGTDIQTLAGMGVNVSYGWGEDFKGHDQWFKIGTITAVTQVGNEIHAEGHLWKNDFPDICDTIECAKEALGCSVELYFEKVEYDDDAKLITGKSAHFTGVAILYKSKAAFKKTSIMCALMSAEGEKEMNEEMKKALEEQEKKNAEQFAAITAAMDSLTKTVQALSEKKDEPKHEPKDEGKEQSLSAEAIAKAVAEGVKAAMAEKKPVEKQELSDKDEPKNEPTRKTAQAFSTVQKKDEVKTYMELCDEVDKDASLSSEQKWAKKLAIWNHRNDAE